MIKQYLSNNNEKNYSAVLKKKIASQPYKNHHRYLAALQELATRSHFFSCFLPVHAEARATTGTIVVVPCAWDHLRLARPNRRRSVQCEHGASDQNWPSCAA
jgi:hypothetical protein